MHKGWLSAAGLAILGVAVACSSSSSPGFGNGDDGGGGSSGGASGGASSNGGGDDGGGGASGGGSSGGSGGGSSSGGASSSGASSGGDAGCPSTITMLINASGPGCASCINSMCASAVSACTMAAVQTCITGACLSACILTDASPDVSLGDAGNACAKLGQCCPLINSVNATLGSSCMSAAAGGAESLCASSLSSIQTTYGVCK